MDSGLAGEQFSLCWNNFHSNLTTGFHSLLKEEDLVDVTLATEGKFIKAHKLVLSVCSPFFKDLFRVNPCKHPIVILQDVSYGALKNLLQFMYQGEVSVSQEEIPAFMKVAETLKVKGLTDNTDASNGLPTNKNSFGIINNDPNINNRHDNILKRPSRTAKKLVRPMQPLRPLENPKTLKLSHSPPQSVCSAVGAKKQHLETFGTSPKSSSTICGAALSPPLQNEALPLIKLKEEPLIEEDDDDDNDDDDAENINNRMRKNNFGTRSAEETDLANILDTQLSGEPSPSSQSWSGGTTGEMVMEENSQPGTLQLILSRRGTPRLILDGYVFYRKSIYKRKVFWYCKNSRSMEKCPSVVWTINGNIVKWPCAHNHDLFPDFFNPDEDSEVPIENFAKTLLQTSIRIFGNLCIIKSGKGQLVLIHDGHMYTFVDQCENKGFWICVKKRMLNCSGCATTMHGQIVHSLGHNHPQIHDVIQRLQVPKSI